MPILRSWVLQLAAYVSTARGPRRALARLGAKLPWCSSKRGLFLVGPGSYNWHLTVYPSLICIRRVVERLPGVGAGPLRFSPRAEAPLKLPPPPLPPPPPRCGVSAASSSSIAPASLTSSSPSSSSAGGGRAAGFLPLAPPLAWRCRFGLEPRAPASSQSTVRVLRTACLATRAR